MVMILGFIILNLLRKLAIKYGLPKTAKDQGAVVHSVVSLTSSLRVISLTVLADSIYNILIFQHICISLDVNFNESLTNDIVSFEQLGPVIAKRTSSENKFFVCNLLFWWMRCNTWVASKKKGQKRYWKILQRCDIEETEKHTIRNGTQS